jgi:hypothetical protein
VSEPRSWLLLIHQIPAKPDYLRVKVGRRLQRVGAVAVKAGVYALPATDECREDLGWIVREVVDGGGEAQVVEARLVEGLDDDALVARFNAARDDEAAPIVDALRALPDGEDGDAELKRLRKRVDELAPIDFFGATKLIEARGWLQRLDAARAPATEAPPARDWRGLVWVTRSGIKVDRMASAWLIRRFVDPDAAFRWVPGRSHVPAAGEARFDMVEAEFGHEGDECTFEVLVRRNGLTDPGLGPIAQMVHDIDVKDGRYGRPETEGFAMTIDAIAAAHPDDDVRLERASAWLDDLLVLYRQRRA